MTTDYLLHWETTLIILRFGKDPHAKTDFLCAWGGGCWGWLTLPSPTKSRVVGCFWQKLKKSFFLSAPSNGWCLNHKGLLNGTPTPIYLVPLFGGSRYVSIGILVPVLDEKGLHRLFGQNDGGNLWTVSFSTIRQGNLRKKFRYDADREAELLRKKKELIVPWIRHFSEFLKVTASKSPGRNPGKSQKTPPKNWFSGRFSY